MRVSSYVAGILVALSLSCTNADALSESAEQATAEPTPTAEPGAAEPVAHGGDSVERAAGASAEPAEPAESPFPALMFDLLDAGEQATFTRLAEAELCPCDGVVASLATCLSTIESSCELSLQAAVIMMRMVKEGADEVEITDAVQSHIANARRVHEFDLEGVPWQGADDPSITLTCFSDFECPHCRDFAEVLHQVIQAYPDTVRVYYKQFPLGQHPNAQAASLAALGAARQGQFPAYHDAVFARQPELQAAEDPRPLLLSIGESLGLNMERFIADLQDPELRAQVDRDRTEGVAAGLTSTPTLFFDGVMSIGGYDLEVLSARIDARLAALANP